MAIISGFCVKKMFWKVLRHYLKCLALSLPLSITMQLLLLMFENPITKASDTSDGMNCQDLLMGQYLCPSPDVDPATQQARWCNKATWNAPVWCTPAPGVFCHGLFENGTFRMEVPCKWTNGHSFETSLLLSIFLGMFGVDRFYLGYPAIGLVKFATLGLMFIGQLIDILLIATQVLTPADGSAYVIDYFGTATSRVLKDNETVFKDW